MYHRLAEVSSDPWSLCVKADHFAEHLEVLKGAGYPLRLQQLIQTIRDGNIPSRGVVITFDDGYADNLHQAKPLLERYDVPATVFITTGQVGEKGEFWWDELERLLLQPDTLPDICILKINSSTYKWKLDMAAFYSGADRSEDRSRKPWEAQPHSRLAFYYSVWKQLRDLPENQRKQVLDEILNWSGADQTVRATHRALLPEEVIALGEGELIEIGAHAVNHPILSVQSRQTQQYEIQKCKVDLEKMLGRRVNSFAYPYGEYTPEVIKLIQEAGFCCACSTREQSVWWQTDRFQLPRFEVQDWNGEEFARRLSWWFDS